MSQPINQANVTEFLDKAAITQTLYEYCDVLDRSTFEGVHILQRMKGLMTADASFEHGTGVAFSGVEAWIDYATKMRIPNRYSLHTYSNFLIDVHGDEAHGTCYAVGNHWWDDHPGYLMRVGAMFEDTFRRSTTGWKIASIRLHLRFMDDPKGLLKGWQVENTH